MKFRTLNDLEEEQFRDWASDNYTPFDNIPEFWHPVVREECHKINAEASVEPPYGVGTEEGAIYRVFSVSI